MKKFIAVAMIALLAVTSVFAGFKGEVTTSFTVDVNDATNPEYGFVNGTPGFELTFEATTQEGANAPAKDGKVWAEFGGKVVLQNGKTTSNGAVPLNAKFKDAYFNLAGQDWTLDLLGAAGLTTYASDWREDNDGNVADLVKQFNAEGAGVTLTYKGYSVGFGLAGVNDKVNTSLTFASADFLADEELTLKAAAGVAYKAAEEYIDLGFGTTFAYANDEVSATVAVDGNVNVGTAEGKDLKWGVDASVNAAYDFISADAYFATEAKGGPVADATKNYYDAQVNFDLGKIVENVPLTLGVQVIDIKSADAGAVGANVGVALVEKKLNITANGGYDLSGKWNAGAGVSYADEEVILGKVYGSFGLEDKLATEALDEVNVKFGYSSSKLIDGAAFGIEYKTGNLLAKEYGTITASISAEF